MLSPSIRPMRAYLGVQGGCGVYTNALPKTEICSSDLINQLPVAVLLQVSQFVQ